MTEKNLSLFGIITSAINPVTHDNDRAVLIYSRNDNPIALNFKEFCNTITGDEVLKTCDLVEKSFGESAMMMCQIKNVSASRKKFEVTVRKFFSH